MHGYKYNKNIIIPQIIYQNYQGEIKRNIISLNLGITTQVQQKKSPHTVSNGLLLQQLRISHRNHVWYMYLHLP